MALDNLKRPSVVSTEELIIEDLAEFSGAGDVETLALSNCGSCSSTSSCA